MKLTLITLLALVHCLSAEAHMPRLNTNAILKPRVALTRETSKNNVIKKMLTDVDCVDIPCISFERGRDEISMTLLHDNDVVVLSSPQGADIFSASWIRLGKPKIRVVSVGKGTSEILSKYGITSIFEPSKSTGECLAIELPKTFGTRVLYPTSDLAHDTIQRILTQRGFHVTRLEAYRTCPADWSPEQYIAAKTAHVVAIASPSAAQVWASRIGTECVAVTIGPTSESAARQLGFQKIVPCVNTMSESTISSFAKTISQECQQWKS